MILWFIINLQHHDQSQATKSYAYIYKICTNIDTCMFLHVYLQYLCRQRFCFSGPATKIVENPWYN